MKEVPHFEIRYNELRAPLHPASREVLLHPLEKVFQVAMFTYLFPIDLQFLVVAMKPVDHLIDMLPGFN
jgi:hypothetical protein